MSTLKPRTRAAVAVAIAGIVATTFTGCFPNPADLVKQGAEKAIEDATGGDVSLGGELPAGFPESIPLVDGEVSFAAGAGGAEGWVVIIKATTAEPFADAAAKLEGAGFTKDASLAQDGSGALIYQNADYVVVVAGQGGDISYTVAPAQ